VGVSTTEMVPGAIGDTVVHDGGAVDIFPGDRFRGNAPRRALI
jgi:hypothetical protein